MKTKGIVFLSFVLVLEAQNVDIGRFYYRDYLDFGQGYGAFSGENSGNAALNSATLTGKDGTRVSVPNVPNFGASSRNGSLTAVGRSFAVSANHVVNFTPDYDTLGTYRKFDLSTYQIADKSSGSGVSKPYGRDEKFTRFDKYVVEGQVNMLDFTNSIDKEDASQENTNITNFKALFKDFAQDNQGNVYIYQTGSGTITLREGYTKLSDINRDENGQTRGGGFGTLVQDSLKYGSLVLPNQFCDSSTQNCNVRGIVFNYAPNLGFNNRITSGDSGSGIYAYDKTKNEWVLLGVVSQSTTSNIAYIAAVSNKDLQDYKNKFEQKINLKIQDPTEANTWSLNNGTLTYKPRGDTPNSSHTLQQNKDIIFSGGGTVEVTNNIYRNTSGYAGGFVFEKAGTQTTYKFINANGGNYYFKGSGLDIGENVKVEWALRNDKDDSLHKIGKGELIVKTDYTPNSGENLGYLKIGEGKVTLDTTKKAFEGIYITSGRGELALVKDKAQALGASKTVTNGANSASGANSANSYTLAQDGTSNMGFYFGKGGGKFDLSGNSLVLNTIAANDSKALITNSSSTAVNLEIEGLGYDTNNKKTQNKADTIIHASIGDNANSTSGTNGANGTNLNLIYKGDKTAVNRHSNASEESKNSSLLSTKAQNDNNGASLIFDGHINTSGSLSATNANVALQGHATTHATISDTNIANKVQNAEKGTSKAMPNYMDLSKPSTLNQPDWDDRIFKIAQGITLTNSTLTLGRNATLQSNITASGNSKIEFGGGIKHFIDNKDGKNVIGSGFSYQQKVESGALSAEMQKLANQTTKYKGKITADGTTIQSHIWDFNASLDLKNSAKLSADYLTLTNSDSIALDSSSSANVKTLKLQSISNSDLSTIFKNSNTTTNAKLKVSQALWFDSVNSFDLDKLGSANVDIESNYDIVATKSTVTGNTKTLSANVKLFEGANLTLKSLTLKDTKANEATSGRANALKNLVYLEGDSTKDNSSQTNTTKLTLTEGLKAENLDKAQVVLWGKSEIIAPTIEFSSVKGGMLLLDSEAKLTNANNQNANVEVKGVDSTLNIFVSGNQSFNLNASGANSKVTLQGIPSDFNPAPKNKPSTNVPNPSFSGKITAGDSSVVVTALDSITASVDLSGSASLSAKNIELDSTHNSINLKGSSTLVANTITAKNLTNLTLTQENGATANITKFIFDGGTIASGLNTLIGSNISLIDGANITLKGSTNGVNLSGKNISLESIDSTKISTLKATNLTFNGENSSSISLDKDSKLEIEKLNVDRVNLALNLADSKANTEKLTGVTLSNNANLTLNSWDFGNTTTFTSTDNSRVHFMNATYSQNGSAKTISADSTISGALSLSNVGKAQATQTNQNSPSTTATDPNISTDSRFESLKFDSKNLTFGADSSISVSFDSGVKKGESSIKTDGTYYKLISAGSITDKRTDKRIDFKNTNFFVVSKFVGNNLVVKFLESTPNTFGELNKNISHDESRYSDILKALTEHNQNDEAIDIATRTDDYAILDERIKAIDGAMNEIAQGNKTSQTRNLLFSNDQTINTRIVQVRLAQRSQKHLRFAHNDAMYRIQTLLQGAVLSDAMPSYVSKRESSLSNSVWLNVGGGYFSGDSKVGFGATNIGYDRLLDNSEVLLGAMLGFGGSKAHTGEMIDNAMFYNAGLYLHSIFDARGEQYGGHEIQSNLNFSINDNNKSLSGKNFATQSAKNKAFGTLISMYYKYNFIVAQSDEISHALKPIVLLALGYNRNGAFKSVDYKQEAYNSLNLSYGFGVEYNVVQNESFYSASLTLKDMAYSGGERVFVSLSGARNFIGYTLESAPRFSAEINLIGSHKLTDEFYLQYGIAGMADIGANYGAKGDMKLGYKF